MKKKIGLAISGGGARGAAAIGVLRIIEQAGIRPDFVAGTSAGAIVGALYCCGYDPDRLAQFYCSQSWYRLLTGNRLRQIIDELTGYRGDIDFDTLPIPFRCESDPGGQGYLRDGQADVGFGLSPHNDGDHLPHELGFYHQIPSAFG